MQGGIPQRSGRRSGPRADLLQNQETSTKHTDDNNIDKEINWEDSILMTLCVMNIAMTFGALIAVGVSGHSPAETDSPRLVEKQLKLKLLGDSGATVEDLGHHAGYYRLPNTVDASPLIWNDYGWDKVSNLIYVDQTDWKRGFSYSSSMKDIRYDENGVSNDLYAFLQEFFKAHPKYAKNEFFVTGESYAGHYIPALGTRINQGNKKKEGIYINLKGLGIGNGLTDPGIQYPAYPDFALDNNLISKSFHDELTQLIRAVKKL
nr:serine carboxypeptidase-like [Ipomoea batatas]